MNWLNIRTLCPRFSRSGNSESSSSIFPEEVTSVSSGSVSVAKISPSSDEVEMKGLKKLYGELQQRRSCMTGFCSFLAPIWRLASARVLVRIWPSSADESSSSFSAEE